ncbi:MAG TPA: amidohydrolase family protein [Thermoplasmata archaeon]|nr:amidohydrolase family protein [Thermoplasmata archaeon]
MIVEGALVDSEGAHSGYLRIKSGRIVERGAIGTDSTRGRERRVRGIALPAPVNSHTHLGDAAFGREPPAGPVSRIVAPPHGVKFRVLSATPPAAKRAAIREALGRMVREGVGAVVDFREEGLPGIETLRAAAKGLPIEVIALGRPLARPLERGELDRLLARADGVGLSSAREEDLPTRTAIASACRTRGKRYALHASEVVREPVDAYLRPRPDLLIHMFRATEPDLRAVAEENVAVAVCPRSNALFGHVPDFRRFERAGVRVLLGTDNAMFSAPSMLRELEFAYASQRLLRRPVSPSFLVRAAFLEPWKWLGQPERSRLDAGNPAPPLVLRLPVDDPEYQVVTRAADHLIIRSATGGVRGPSR